MIAVAIRDLDAILHVKVFCPKDDKLRESIVGEADGGKMVVSCSLSDPGNTS